MGKTADIPRSLLNPMAASCGAGIVSGLILYSLGFAESLCFNNQVIKINFWVGKMESFLESFYFLGFLWNMLCYPHHTHTSPLPSAEGSSQHLKDLNIPGICSANTEIEALLISPC